MQPNYFTATAQAQALRERMKIARRMIAQWPFDRYRGQELSPGDDVRSNADIDRFVRRTVTGLFQPVGIERAPHCSMTPRAGRCRP